MTETVLIVTSSPALLLSLPELPPDQIEWVYDSDWYDGPINGVLEFGGEGLWFHCVSRLRDRSRVYAAFRLAAEWVDYETDRQEFYEQFEGFDSEADWKPYWDRYPPEKHPEYEGELVGWIRM